MDEKLNYNQESKITSNSVNWKSNISSQISTNHKSRNISLGDHVLSYIPQNDETRSKRRIIPSTRLERLSYFRCYVTTHSKIQVVHQALFNRFLWNYISTVFFKSLPHTFVYIFLASYAPDEHFFLTKMAPICSGFTIIYILAAILDMTTYIEMVILLLDYSICGLLFKTPWNRCSVSDYLSQSNITINCYNIDELKKFGNGTVAINTTYMTSDGEHFQMAPVYYFKKRLTALKGTSPYGSIYFLYFLFLWTIVSLHYKQLYTRYIWKSLDIVHNFVNLIFFIVFVHLTLVLFTIDSDYSSPIPSMNDLQKIFYRVDFDLLSESTTTPPTVHILTARSSQEILPTRDSAVIIVSNAIYYIFRGLLAYKLKSYCEYLIKIPITFTISRQDSFYFYWPLYFSTFYLGEFYSIIFFFVRFLMELYTLIITHQCLVEAIVCEWRQAKRFFVTIAIYVLAIPLFIFMQQYERVACYVLVKSMVTMMEIIGIYVIYPVGRLIDDITFYNGVTPTKLRIFSLRLVPAYYGIKLYIMYNGLIEANYRSKIYAFIAYSFCCYSVMLVTVIIGVIYACYVYIWKKKESCTSLFRPDDTWGPPFNIRQLRKQYESREFVGSQAPRLLSRYLIKKALVYKLDVCYETNKPSASYETRTENERKSV